MKRIGIFKFISAVFACVLLFNVSAEAQKRRPARTTKTAAASKSATTAANMAAVKAGAHRVADRIRTLTQFIYLLGATNVRISTVEAQRGKLNQSAQEQVDAGKKGIVLTIRNIRLGLKDLEDEFRANAALRPFLMQLVGVAELGATAEEQATAEQYEQAGRTLLEVVGQLTDVLIEMP